MRSASLISACLRAFGRAAVALVLAFGLLSAGRADAMSHGFSGGGFHGGGFHGGFHDRFHGGFHDRFHGGFHDRDFDHDRFHHRFFFHHGFFFGGFGGYYPYYPYYPYDYPSYYYPYEYPYYDPPPAGVTQAQPNCQSGQWRQQDGSVVSGTACLQPDGSWRMGY